MCALTLLAPFGRADASTLEDFVASSQARLEWAGPVAKAKWHSGQAIEDPEREAIVLDQAVARAHAQGVDPNLARRVFRAQIDASKTLQAYWFVRWGERGPDGPPPDLARDVRPQLDRIGDELVAELRELNAIAESPGCWSDLVRAVRAPASRPPEGAPESTPAKSFALDVALAGLCGGRHRHE